MGLFDSFSSFLSDQSSRINNVINTEKAVVSNIVNTLTLGTVGTQTKIVGTDNAIGKLGSAIANNPLTTAALIAVPSSSAARSTIAGLSTGAKVGLASGVFVAASVAKTNPSLVLSGPSDLSDFTGRASSATSLSDLNSLVSDHPIISTALAGVGLYAATKVLAPALPGIVAATKKSTVVQVQPATPISLPPTPLDEKNTSPVVNSSTTGAVPYNKNKKKQKKRSKKKKKHKKRSIKKKKKKNKR